ncbi:MAG TPA: PDZ domain-containing protein [Steroidobacteraceae bacterium]|jgi:membrane-associated protease RseP (regulator of RpoE activity)|nr:PDZ domain-containing protein [Steroidobacteraceae bacterium]
MARYLLIIALAVALLAAWFLLRGERGEVPAPPVPLASPAATAPAPAPAGVPAVAPTGSTSPLPAPAAPEEGAAAALPPVGAASASSGVDERQNAKIARGLASNSEGGLVVQSAPPASVVQALRLQPGDVIVTVDGAHVSVPEDFVRLYRAHGMPTELTIVRDGREVHLH